MFSRVIDLNRTGKGMGASFDPGGILLQAEMSKRLRAMRVLMWDALYEAKQGNIPFTPVYFYKGTLTIGDKA